MTLLGRNKAFPNKSNHAAPIFSTIRFSSKVQDSQGLDVWRDHITVLGKTIFFVVDRARETGLDSAKVAFLWVINDRPRSRPSDIHPHPLPPLH